MSAKLGATQSAFRKVAGRSLMSGGAVIAHAATPRHLPHGFVEAQLPHQSRDSSRCTAPFQSSQLESEIESEKAGQNENLCVVAAKWCTTTSVLPPTQTPRRYSDVRVPARLTVSKCCVHTSAPSQFQLIHMLSSFSTALFHELADEETPSLELYGFRHGTRCGVLPPRPPRSPGRRSSAGTSSDVSRCFRCNSYTIPLLNTVGGTTLSEFQTRCRSRNDNAVPF